eukprot:SAG11_NODE_11361_length_766_cov_0.881559_1_plen_78_part_00
MHYFKISIMSLTVVPVPLLLVVLLISVYRGTSTLQFTAVPVCLVRYSYTTATPVHVLSKLNLLLAVVPRYPATKFSS